MPAPEVVDLGREAHAVTHQRMLTHAQELRKRELPGWVLLVEHDPVYTAGRATPAADLTDDMVQIERGGQITYHGPGQLVVYPILRLPQRDVRAWLRSLEDLGVAVCAACGLAAAASVDGTGVFVGEQKVISIGVAIRHWINMHGLAINVDLDLAPFARIRPCGLNPDTLTDLTRLSGRAVSLAEVKRAVRQQLHRLWSPTGDAR